MDEALLRRVVGLLTLGVIAFLLSWLLPRPGLERLQGGSERIVTMDLTRPDSQPEELSAEEAASRERLRAGMDVADAALLAEVQGGAVPRAENPVSAPDPAERPRPEVADADADVAPAEAAPLVEPETVDEPVPKPVPAPKPAPPAAPAVKPEAPKPAPKPAPRPAPPAPKAEIAKPEAKPAPKPQPKVEPKPAPKPEPKPQAKPEPAKPAAKPAAATGKTRVQAGAYSHLDSAEAVRAKASAQGVACVISPAETAKGTLYRLRCGPYADRAAAEAAVRKLKAVSIPAAVVGD